ncbi:MAG: nucleoside recognition domain-containing protein, partial [Caulobacteraceae bacterium]
YSFAGMIGHAIQPLLAPIGFNWQMAVALVPGMAAREVAVGALGTVYAIGEGAPGQLASTLAVVKRETNAWRWPIIMFVYMIALAYLAAFATFQIATRLGA